MIWLQLFFGLWMFAATIFFAFVMIHAIQNSNIPPRRKIGWITFVAWTTLALCYFVRLVL